MTRDPRILRACPFCDEAVHLRIDEGAFERVAVVDGQVREITWSGCQAIGAEYVDLVQCLVCDTMAALDVWNRTRPAADYAALRDFDEAQDSIAEAA